MKIEYICICMLCIIFLLKIQYNKECFNPNVFSPIITSDLDMNLRNALGDKEYENIISRGKSKKRIITKPVTISNNEILSDSKFSLGGRWLRGFDNFGAGPRNSRTAYVGGNNLFVTKFDSGIIVKP